VLDVLAVVRARATFFVVGRAARAAPDLVRRIAAEGHEIGNHSYSHRHPWTLRESEARDEVRNGAAVISDVLGGAPRAFEAARSGQRTVLWSVSAIDWGPLGSASRIEARLRTAGAGDIVLMHDGRNRHNRPDELLQVLPRALADLSKRGLTAAALPE
jgi:peptidoglycan/xylan/chitin deacetylase (PgdA/CDA1 family)